MKKLVYLDCCYPDYFTGSDLPTLAVCVWHGMTGRELKEAIIDEYNNMDDSFPEIDIEKATDEFMSDNDNEELFKLLEPDNYDCYLYIGVVGNEHH